MRKFLIFFVVLLMFGSALVVSADTPQQGTLNSAALTYFTGVVNKLPPNTNYVIYRVGDNSSALVYSSDLVFNNNIFSSSDCVRLVYDSRGFNTGTNQYSPTVTTSNIRSFTLTTANQYILYSNLGHYSSVGETNKDVFSYILWSVVFLILIFIVFKFFRNRRHYINL